MAQQFKAHRLFRNNEKEYAFIDNLEVSNDEIGLLKECRRDVRNYLRNGFSLIRKGLREQHKDLSSEIKSLEPRFMTQGSFEYKTLNNPAINPPQQIDLDDGVYFPMALVNGKPQAAKITLLNLVREILYELAKNKNWELTQKSTCLRLGVNSRIHIDVPVYAIPEERHVLMTEALKAEGRATNSLHFDDAIIALDPSEVHLARWDTEEWVVSDPKQLHDWFISKAKMHGQSLRPLCRYLKSWRDINWAKGGPTSIALMASVVQVYDEHLMETKRGFNSDCEALLYVTDRLPNIFASSIKNPVNEESELYPAGVESRGIDEIKTRLRELSSQVTSALCESQNEYEVTKTLQKVFGGRIPNKPEWVERLTAREKVKNTPPLNPPVPNHFPENHRSA